MQKRGLGKGLGALIASADTPEETEQNLVETDKIVPNPFQPRVAFDEAKLDELAASIRESGMLQPLLLRRAGDRYELVAGERRWRAAIRAGLKQVPAVVKSVDERDLLALALIENLQREDLNPIEEARAFRRLQEEFGLKQEEISQRVGRSRPAVANSLRLLLLPEEVQNEVALGRLPAGQARALLALEKEALMIAAAREVIAKGLSTRETENHVRRLKLNRRRRKEASALDPDLQSLVENLQRSLGTKVRLTHHAKTGKGKLEIEYYSTSDLDRISRKILHA
ncbi:MAG TPA: ParB/RepB/Spo0J family partition protein [Candidatus Acidoferrales bacterium]|nr:ParB/RepB/Spo0J family partition protein [Candidatus Acidoferrales bacterium]